MPVRRRVKPYPPREISATSAPLAAARLPFNTVAQPSGRLFDGGRRDCVGGARRQLHDELRAAAFAAHLPALADDSGLCVAALDGAPGIYSARWAGEAKDFTAAMAPTLDGLGVDGKGGHTDYEQLYVSSLVPRARLMLGLFEELS